MEEYKGFWKIAAYSVGMAGWSILINTISVMLVFYYLPPDSAGMPVLIPNILLFGVFTLFSFILASGRLIDAVTDPFIAWLSDRSKLKWGRRIPFMAVSLLPSAFFSILIFLPPFKFESTANYLWLFLSQAGFYISLTLYIVPFNALMPELAATKDAKLVFSTVLSVMFISGLIIASQIPYLSELLSSVNQNLSYQDSYFYSITLIIGFAFILMLIPVISIDEKRYCNPVPVKASVITSLLYTLRNKKFVIFLVADASFFLTLTIISSGIIFYVKVLLELSDSFASKALGLMIIISLFFYPIVIWLVRRHGKKSVIIISFFIFSAILLYISFLGRLPFRPEIQLALICLIGAFPFAVLGILPYNIVAEIAELDGRKTGEQREGMYFAVRTFAGKLGQTLGVMLFAIFIIYGKDIGNDMGIRYSAIAASVISLFSAIWFFKYKE